MKKITLIGSTGSIGVQTLEVVEKLKNNFEIYALSCGKNIKLLKEQILKFNPKKVCVQEKEDALLLEKEFPKEKFKIDFFFGLEGLNELATDKNYDIFVVATSGTTALSSTLLAIQNKKKIALANKETLVMAGDIVTKKAKENGVDIIPIDSEHSAILQCMNSLDNKFAKKLWITASGGPFLNNSREDMARFSAKEALKHPRWSMGRKITIDSSTLVNKGFEVIEAHHLYDFSYDDIKVVIHPQSIVHSFVEFLDGSFLAQMGVPSMHIPIQYALTYPKRLEGIKTDSFNPCNLKLEFFEPDFEKFPLLKLAIEIGKEGGLMPAIYNAANEIAVYKFLEGKIDFLDIEKVIFKEIEQGKNKLNPSLEEIFETDKEIRERLKKDL